MYLREFELRNFRKFYYKENDNNCVCFSSPHNNDGINVASRTSLIVGANNCGKTTIISCLEKLLSSNPSFTEFDFNLDYVKEVFNSYPTDEDASFDNLKSPEISFVLKIELDDTDDLINNISPFLKISNLDNKIVEICAKWEVKEREDFFSKCREINAKYKKYCLNSKNDTDKDTLKKKLEADRFHLLVSDNFQLNFYDSFGNLVKNFKLNNLIEIVSIKSNKLDADKSLSNALKKIIKFRYGQDIENQDRYFDDQLFNVETKISEELSSKYIQDINETFNHIIASHQVAMKLDLSLDNLMNTLIRCEYLENQHSIPENQYGFGYTNLIVIISEIVSYIDNYHNEKRNSQIHLIAIEEPEAYMHPQMQELFIKKITEAINELLKGKAKNINSQLLITTHSPHILNSKIHHGCSLNNINYIKCEHNIPKIVNLNDENIVSPNNSAADLAFIQKHIKFKISELFFAEAAIFVEGITEYHLLQHYIDNDNFLSTKTISTVLIDGAHAMVYENLIKSLGIPVTIITDLDIQRQKEEKGEGDNGDKTFIQVKSLETRDTTNNTLIYFYQGEKN